MVAGLGLSLLGLGDRLMLPALGEALELVGLRERLGLGNSLLLGTGLQPGCCITSHGAACMGHGTRHPPAANAWGRPDNQNIHWGKGMRQTFPDGLWGGGRDGQEEVVLLHRKKLLTMGRTSGNANSAKSHAAWQS